MKTCKDCYFFECCSTLNPEFKKYPRDYIETDLCAKQCTKFKDKRLIIEVPCTVGDIVYCDLDKTIFTKFWQSEFGKYVFTKEQYQKLKPTKLSVRKAMKTDGLDI